MSTGIKYKNIKYVTDSHTVHTVSQIHTAIVCYTANVLEELLQKTKVNVSTKRWYQPTKHGTVTSRPQYDSFINFKNIVFNGYQHTDEY